MRILGSFCKETPRATHLMNQQIPQLCIYVTYSRCAGILIKGTLTPSVQNDVNFVRIYADNQIFEAVLPGGLTVA